MAARRRRLRAAAASSLLVPSLAAALQIERELAPREALRHAAPPDAATPLFLRPALRIERLAPAPAAAPRPFGEPTQEVVVSLKVNGVPKDERIARMTAGGAFLLPRAEIESALPLAAGAAVHEIEGEAYVALASLPGVKVSFDERTLTLDVVVPASQFPAQRFDLTAPPVPVDLHSTEPSALVTYRAGYAGTEGGSGTLSLALDAAAQWGDWILRNRSFHARTSEETLSIRQETQLLRDDRANLRRLVVGDASLPGLALGSAAGIAGLTFAKAYILSPYFVRQPRAGYSGIVDFPSQVDFYVGNTLVMRQRVAPGPFDIQNFTYFGGQRDVRVVVRDMFGREQTIAYPFYFASQGLAAGLHDYSYQAGWLRTVGIDGSPDYGRFALAAFHQYGFSDALTLGVRAEATRSRVNGGPDMVYRTERFGLFGLRAAASHDRDERRDGHAVSFSHAFQRNELSTQVIAQRFSEGYRLLGEERAATPLSDLTASVGMSSAAYGSVSLAFTRLELREGIDPIEGLPASERLTRSVALSYSKHLGRGLNLTAVARKRLGEPGGHEFFAGLQYLPGGDQAANLTVNRDLAGTRTTALQWSNQVPRGEGLAWLVGLQRQQSAEGDARLFAPRLDWYTRWATVSAEATRLEGGAAASATAYSLALSGSLLGVGGHFMASRPVADSFAVAEIVPPIEGVRVYENNQEIGRTDARGRILLPNITSYANNFVSIDDKDVPIEYSIGKVGRTFSPVLRSGTRVPFAVERVRTFTGTFHYRVGGERRPLEYHLVVVSAGERRFEVASAREGAFYVENLPAGRHRAEVELRGRRCEFTLVVPQTPATEIVLGEVDTCDAP